ncbi:unnamed protein product, partial [Rhizoctonia solani]
KQKARAELSRELSRELYVHRNRDRPYADEANSWRQICEIEANELKGERYGVELLNMVGFIYVAKAKHPRLIITWLRTGRLWVAA